MTESENRDWRKNLLLTLYCWYGKSAEIKQKNSKGCNSLLKMAVYLHIAMAVLWHPRDDGYRGPLLRYSNVSFCTWALLAKGGQNTCLFACWTHKCANCNMMSEVKYQLKSCARCKAFYYCSEKCQVEHWEADHKVDCKGHWIEAFFPDIRKAHE